MIHNEIFYNGYWSDPVQLGHTEKRA